MASGVWRWPGEGGFWRVLRRTGDRRQPRAEPYRRAGAGPRRCHRDVGDTRGRVDACCRYLSLPPSLPQPPCRPHRTTDAVAAYAAATCSTCFGCATPHTPAFALTWLLVASWLCPRYRPFFPEAVGRGQPYPPPPPPPSPMTLVVPFALVLGFLALLLAVAVFLLWRKRRNARVEAAAFAESLAARERRREARSKKTGLLTRREIESIAPESIHAPPPCGDEEDALCNDGGGNHHVGGQLGAGAGGPEKLVGASGSITSSSLDGEGEELRGTREGGGAGSSAPQAGSVETPFPSKVEPQGAGDYTEADHRGDPDADAEAHPEASADDEGRRPEGAVKRPGADYLPGSTLTCAICLGTFCAREGIGAGGGGEGGCCRLGRTGGGKVTDGVRFFLRHFLAEV